MDGTMESSYCEDYPQLPGFAVLTSEPSPADPVTLTGPEIESLQRLGEVMAQIRFLATARASGALAQIEILASAMSKTPRLLAEGASPGMQSVLDMERAAAGRALSIGLTHVESSPQSTAALLGMTR